MSRVLRRHIVINIKYLTLMNLAFFLGAHLVGGSYMFSCIISILVPMCCAEAALYAMNAGLCE
ncbi:hypothetical protein SAMN02910298_02477 [Pseudobutyrivibrio sp. YE44]|uniref:hypothetical protein n=1 Tax=Pseudobutyrivibrio sp. YE44 TaxID=1520802 RepID=UPI000889814F|nr:hypothetical protein [Pseudobutyrivibrio sp. YE44]SDB49280.1 hypothetical protein SAMN02910298_02477 [Pseudobutyrivibrio sp. YE44]